MGYLIGKKRGQNGFKMERKNNKDRKQRHEPNEKRGGFAGFG